MHVSALDVQAFRPQKALHLNPVLTIAELQDELRAIGQNNLIIVVNVVTVRGGRNVKWEVGKDPMDSRLVPEGWNQDGMSWELLFTRAYYAMQYMTDTLGWPHSMQEWKSATFLIVQNAWALQ